MVEGGKKLRPTLQLNPNSEDVEMYANVTWGAFRSVASVRININHPSRDTIKITKGRDAEGGSFQQLPEKCSDSVT